jgi:hypothetical protein
MPPTPTHTSRAGDAANRYFITGAFAETEADGLRTLSVNLLAVGEFSYPEVRALSDAAHDGRMVQLHLEPLPPPTTPPDDWAGDPATPTHTSRAGDGPEAATLTDAYAAIEEAISNVWYVYDLDAQQKSRAEDRFVAVAHLLTHLADLLDGVLADDPAAIRDAAAWLAANRPEVDG